MKSITNYLDELKQLDADNLNRVRVLFEEIDNEFQIKKKPEAIIPYLPRHCRPRPSKDKITTEYTQYEYDEVKKRLNALNFLIDQEVLNGYNVDSSHHRDDGNTDWHIEIKLNAHTFQNFKSSLKKATDKTHIEPSVDNWHESFIFKKNQKLENLDSENINNLNDIVTDIYKEFQTNPSPEVKLNLSFITIASYNYRETINFLLQKHIVLEINYRSCNSFKGQTALIKIDVNEFLRLKDDVNRIIGNNSSPQAIIPDNQNNEILYAVTYNEMTGEILINDKVIKKTNLGSLVDIIFAYLHKNPDRKITVAELKKATKKDIKDLPKVIENAGFTGKRLKVFFGRVSKNAVYFRPQITKADLKRLSITSID